MKTEIIKNIRYGTHERHAFDIAFPCGATGDVDLVLIIHGGGWTAGDKSVYSGEIEKIAEGGVVSATMNYRYASENVSCLDILDDITAALAKIKEVAAQKGIKISRALLTGLSAGGHLSLLYAYARADEAPIRPAAVVEQSGPADMFSDEAVEKFIYDNEAGGSDEIFLLFSKCCGVKTNEENRKSPEVLEAARKASPVCFVDENTVPTVICHAVNDRIVPYCNATALEKELEKHGVTHDFVSFPTSGHCLEKDPDSTAEMWRLTWEYINKYLTVFKG